MRIAILAHSTNPRGGVMHALELGNALTRLGHDAVVHAPDPSRRGFGAPTLCRAVSVPAEPVSGDLAALIARRTEDYVRHFSSASAERFDVWHAQDGISGNALLTMRQGGRIAGFGRTVHHVDHFADPRVAQTQQRGLRGADALFVVSHKWRAWLAETLGREATLVGNGVDTGRFMPVADTTDEVLRGRLGIAADDVVLLAIGGIEARKNTLGIVEAFALVHARIARARLVIAGGASLLDHDSYRERVVARLRALALPRHAVLDIGPLLHGEMPALYRLASVLMFPSVREGFGLVILEAQASGVPVVTSAIAPFTEFVEPASVAWCDPDSAPSIAAAAMRALDPRDRPALIAAGRRAAARFGWDDVARAHLSTYRRLSEPAHA